MREQPLDVLAQQIVAEIAAEDWTADELFELVRRAWPYRQLERAEFDAVVTMLAGASRPVADAGARCSTTTRYNGRLRGRRGARLMAMTSGGAIPDNADYRVVLEPEDTFIGTVNEDFAVESMAGDIFQLGNTSWRMLRVERGHGAGRGRPRPAAGDSVLARRGPVAERRALGGSRGASGTRSNQRIDRAERPSEWPEQEVRRRQR